MLYHTIYAYWNFGTWNCWNANLSNGFILCILLYIVARILELGTAGTGNLGNGLYICCIILYMHIESLELGTSGTQI